MDISAGLAHVKSVTIALSAFGEEVRNTIIEADALNDINTADMFTKISRGIDKWLWFVAAHAHAMK